MSLGIILDKSFVSILFKDGSILAIRLKKRYFIAWFEYIPLTLSRVHEGIAEASHIYILSIHQRLTKMI
jgi:hypothetical protein